MIKLVDYKVSKEGSVVYLSKLCIGGMKRFEDTTQIWTNDREPAVFEVKETPEEILSMPDIETTEKFVDWEQRKFDLFKALMARNASELVERESHSRSSAEMLIERITGLLDVAISLYKFSLNE